jgi:hypothetical protein
MLAVDHLQLQLPCDASQLPGAESGTMAIASRSTPPDIVPAWWTIKLPARPSRSLQRLFSNYVGVSPKWVIQRFRLQEAVSHLSKNEPVDLAALAQALGFFDQAHLTRNFTRLVGCSPLAYWTSQQAGTMR